MLLFEAEDQPGVVPDLSSGITPNTVDDIQFDLDFQSILPDTIDLKTPQLTSASQWDPNALRRFSFSNITGFQSGGGAFTGESTFPAEGVPQGPISNATRIKTEGTVVAPREAAAHQGGPLSPSKMRRQRTPSVRAREAMAVAAIQSRNRKAVAPRPSPTKNSPGKAGKTVKRGPSPIPLETHGILPPDHRPARGRGRQNQLARMTKEQIEAEAEARLEKNRQAARECRLRRKQHVELLESRVAQLERERRQQDKIIKQLQAKLAAASA